MYSLFSGFSLMNNCAAEIIGSCVWSVKWYNEFCISNMGAYLNIYSKIWVDVAQFYTRIQNLKVISTQSVPQGCLYFSFAPDHSITSRIKNSRVIPRTKGCDFCGIDPRNWLIFNDISFPVYLRRDWLWLFREKLCQYHSQEDQTCLVRCLAQLF